MRGKGRGGEVREKRRGKGVGGILPPLLGCLYCNNCNYNLYYYFFSLQEINLHRRKILSMLVCST